MKVAFVAAGLTLALAAVGCSSAKAASACTFPNTGEAPSAAFGYRGLSAQLPDGSIVLGANHRHGHRLTVVLTRVGQACQLIRSTKVVATGVHDGFGGGAVATMVATSEGGLLLAGGDGRQELIGRVGSDGQLVRSFGHGGWTRFKPHEDVPVVDLPQLWQNATSISVGPTGSIYVGGNDSGPHCCVQSFLTKLTPGGALVRGFGNNGSLNVPFAETLVANADGSVYAFGEYSESGCGYPTVVKVRSDGSPDRRFDTAMEQTFKRVAPPDYRFTPGLVPGAGDRFALIGGFDRSCGPIAREVYGVLAVAVLASGDLDPSFGRGGQLRPPLPSGAFTRLPSGRLVATGLLYGPHGRRTGVFARIFSRSGRASTLQTVATTDLPHRPYIAGVFAASRGGVLFVIASATEIELIPVR